MSILFIVVLLGVQSTFVGSLLLPFGAIASTASGILGFKISVAASMLSMFTRGFTGTFNFRAGTIIDDPSSEEPDGRSGALVPDVVTTTTEKTEIKVPISALQGILNMNEEQTQKTELLFSFLKSINDHKCVSRLICESAADASRLGKVGKATNHFFNTNVAVKTGAVSVFVAAAKTGRSRGLAGCARAFPECTADIPHILTVAGLT
ncbi:hypothetical protein HPB50_002430 [Hyalomma asiaticum]|uniref:Uncharacterized protein n=1 Tax=Hyalomma asiaticum TaxID=266040 RepID=A0ACB7SAL9_HYAAI|nr:hypothetical protein HPB50_002430 [Hyalomma asiaticum]